MAHGGIREIGSSYNAAHSRLEYDRGIAQAYMCEECGDRVARDWAYRHNDPSPSFHPVKGPYSLNQDCYRPLCRSCHSLGDWWIKKTFGALLP